MVANFIAYKLDSILDHKPITVQEYVASKAYLLSCFRNMLIDHYRKEKTEKKYLDQKETLMSKKTLNISELKEDNQAITYWQCWVDFLKTRSVEEQLLSLGNFPGSEKTAKTIENLAKQFDCSTRTIFRRIEQLENEFKVYLKAHSSK